jgi:transcriptional regulator with XRE-family HTH domain
MALHLQSPTAAQPVEIFLAQAIIAADLRNKLPACSFLSFNHHYSVFTCIARLLISISNLTSQSCSAKIREVFIGIEGVELIGNRIKAAREKLNMSLESVADKLGVSFQSVQQWEAGNTSPRRKRMEKLAEVLQTTPAWLQFGEGYSSESRDTPTDEFIKTDEFMILMRGAHLEAVKLAVGLGWLSEGKKKVTFNTLADVFEGKVKETLFLSDGELNDDIAIKANE